MINISNKAAQRFGIKLFTARPGVSVTVRLDIEVQSPEGFDENTQRAARENSSALGFTESEFD